MNENELQEIYIYVDDSGVLHKNSLYKVLKKYYSFSLIVDINKLFGFVLENKKSICRYKDFALKLTIKNHINNLINLNKINPDLDTVLFINIDQQLTSTNGIYNLKQSIYEEFKNGIINYNYSTKHPSVFNANLKVKIKYCDSKYNYLIQASDILANRVFNAIRLKDNSLIPQNNHFYKKLP